MPEHFAPELVVFDNPFPHWVGWIYSPAEITAMNEEWRLLEPIALGAVGSRTARRNGKPLKRNRALFLDPIYEYDRSASTTLTVNRRLFSPEVSSILSTSGFPWLPWGVINHDTTLISWYGHGDKYEPHQDYSAFSALTYLRTGMFVGGNLYFPDYDWTIQVQSGMTVCFMGAVQHQVTEIASDQERSVRVCMSQFLTIR